MLRVYKNKAFIPIGTNAYVRGATQLRRAIGFKQKLPDEATGRKGQPHSLDTPSISHRQPRVIS
jgi:hypothetical protein